MLCMNLKNAEDKALRAWGAKEKCGYVDHPNESRRIGCTSQEGWHKSVGINRTDWKRASHLCDSKGTDAGGILIQLIEETRQDLANHELEGLKIRDRLQKLELLFDQLETEE